MKLKPDVNLADLLRNVSACEGEIIFESEEGDVLNLKSVLSQYVFGILAEDRELLRNGTLICENTRDIDKIRENLLM